MAEATGHDRLDSYNHEAETPDCARDVAGATTIMISEVADGVTSPPHYTMATSKLGRPQSLSTRGRAAAS